VLTASDKGYAGERVDTSGPLVREILEKEDYIVVEERILPDDFEMLREGMSAICDETDVDLLVTTGGTGFSPRDCMPEVTMEVAERLVPGIPEAMRMLSMQYTKRAMLSRSVCGIRGNTLILNLPGSPKAARENLESVLPALSHGLDMLSLRKNECATSGEE
jgi:molybdenum cofactor synthesis domain-containing protein